LRFLILIVDIQSVMIWFAGVFCADLANELSWDGELCCEWILTEKGAFLQKARLF